MYRAQEDNWGAKIAGFLLVPVVGALAARVAASAVIGPQTPRVDAMNRLIIAGVASHVLGAYVSYRASERDDLSEGVQAFARGGMWGEMFSAASVPAAAVIADRYRDPNQRDAALPLLAAPRTVANMFRPAPQATPMVAMARRNGMQR